MSQKHYFARTSNRTTDALITLGVSRTGTRPSGDLAKNSGDLLSLAWLNSGTSISTQLYSAAIRALKARKLAGFVQSFCFKTKRDGVFAQRMNHKRAGSAAQGFAFDERETQNAL